MTDIPINQNGLLDFIRCEKIDRDLFIGQSKDLNTGQVYGGQVLGQAINAASSTVDEGRTIRSAHAYFIRKGDVNEPIIYNVDRAMDGRSVSSRVVGASQKRKQILHLSASYHTSEDGLDYKPDVKIPTGALERALKTNSLVTEHYQQEFLEVVILSEAEKTNPNSLQFWIKTKHALPDQQSIHHAVLAYISDSGLLFSAYVPHGLHKKKTPEERGITMASIDHAIWFHRPFRADEWFFYECQPISNSGARGLSRGGLYDKDGTLFASTTQEGLLRFKKKA
ncbi:MAG: thioesterase family protein [Acidiferrobacterales bacterium]|nr:thioesterase family protein [Acidiferrobacterales bacterium]